MTDNFHCSRESDIEEIKTKVTELKVETKQIQSILKEARTDIKTLLESKWKNEGGTNRLDMIAIIIIPCLLTFGLNIIFYFIERGTK